MKNRTNLSYAPNLFGFGAWKHFDRTFATLALLIGWQVHFLRFY